MPPGHAIPANGTTCQDGMKILGFLLAGQTPLDTHGNHPLSRGRQKGRKMLKHFAPLLNSSVLLCLACFHRAEKTKKPCPSLCVYRHRTKGLLFHTATFSPCTTS